MPRIDDAIPPPAASVLDRLLLRDEGEPDSRSYREAVASLRRAVLRDLQWILNARIGADPHAPDPFDVQGGRGGELARFGLPDITLLDLRNDKRREELRRWIADAVARFEPRLQDVRVTVKNADERRGSTRFHVEGRLLCDPEPIAFPFEAAVHWADRTIEIQGEKP